MLMPGILPPIGPVSTLLSSPLNGWHKLSLSFIIIHFKFKQVTKDKTFIQNNLIIRLVNGNFYCKYFICYVILEIDLKSNLLVNRLLLSRAVTRLKRNHRLEAYGHINLDLMLVQTLFAKLRINIIHLDLYVFFPCP